MTAAEKSFSQIAFPLCCLRVPREIKPTVCVCVCGPGVGVGGGRRERKGGRVRRKEGKKGMYFKELVHKDVETGKSRFCRAGQQAGNPGKSGGCSLSLKALWR